jgi:glycosyltransferase involved in cell wall biosynthesis
MKLAIVTAYPPSKVTLNEYGYHLVKHFRKNTEITELILLIDRTEGEKELVFEEKGCKITIKECWSFNSFSNILNVTRAINEAKPDSVLFNLQFMKFGDKKIPAALGLMLPLVCKMKGIPCIALLHNILEEVDLESAGFTSNKLLQRVYNFMGSTLTRLILKSDYVAVTMNKYVKVLEEKYKANNVIMVPHGTFEIPEETDYTIPEGPLKVLTFGKFGTYKKVESLIEAIDIIRKNRKIEIELVIAGTDNPNVPGYLEGVKKKYSHIADVTFTGYVDEKDVPKLFQESAVVVFPYTATTGSSGVLHQAGSYGKAVVLPDLGDLSSLIKDEGYRGEFFDPNSTIGLAMAIGKVLTDHKYRMELGKINYQAATAYPMDRIVDTYLGHFSDIMTKKLAVNSSY